MLSKRTLYLCLGTLLGAGAIFVYWSSIQEETNTPIAIEIEKYIQEDKEEITVSSTTDPFLPVRMITYTNPKYRFSVEYPCVSFCDSYAQQPQPNQLGGSRVSIPVSERSYLSLDDFTDEGVAEWNSRDEFGPSEPFQYSINSLRKQLTLPKGSKCSVHSFDNDEAFDCIVTSFENQKAVQFVGVASHGNSPIRHSYINIEKTNKWLVIVEFYPDTFDPTFLTDTSKITEEERKELDAMKAVVDTIKFY